MYFLQNSNNLQIQIGKSADPNRKICKSKLEICTSKPGNLQIQIGNLQIQIGPSADPNRKSANPNREICKSKLRNLLVRIYGRVHLDLATCVGPIWAHWPHWTHLVTLGSFWIHLSVFQAILTDLAAPGRIDRI